jgi:branched-chain amino acid transport system substrate-binding protein
VKKRTWSVAALLTASAMLLSGCASDSGATTEANSNGETVTASGDPIVIGASLPLTGPLQAFGTSLEQGYKAAIDEVNAAGGLDVGGTTHQVELIVQDNASDGNKASEQAKSMVLDDGAIALLGPATPPLSVPVSAVAEQLKVPAIFTITPIEGWLTGTETGYQYSWDVFFDEIQMTETQFLAANTVESNKKVVIFTDTEEDGPIQAALWKDYATKHGYEVVSHIEFPVGNENFSSQVAEAKAAAADIVLAQIIPPDGIALLKEMKAQSYQPKMMFMEKAGNTGGFVDITGGLAEGVMAANWFAEGMGLDREAEFITNFKEFAGGVNSNLGTVVYGYSIAKVLLEAMANAGSLEADAINSAIGTTDAVYPAGHIKFDERHASAMPMSQTQWKGADQILVLTQDGQAANAIEVPVAGLGN